MLKTKIPFYKSPIIMIGISLFFILVLATFYRIYIAFETHPGLVIENAYKKGENYATTLANKEKLKKLGWQIFLDLPKKLTANVQQKYRMRLIQKNATLSKSKISQVTLFFYRPSSVVKDFQIQMTQDKNHYLANVNVPLKGRWDVVAEVSIDNVIIHKGKEVFYR